MVDYKLQLTILQSAYNEQARELAKATAEIRQLKQTLKTVESQSEDKNRTKFMMIQLAVMPAIHELLDSNQNAALKTFFYLAEHSARDGSHSETVRSMAQSLNYSAPTIQASINRLRDKGLIKVVRDGRRNFYCVNPSFCMKMNTKHIDSTAYRKLERFENGDITKDKLSFLTNYVISTAEIKKKKKQQ
ncbi:replication/maintenance protein RepL [Enterovibrio calviensis]|uniref:replication/maintenance protein RepL n=1 Tax=Enterovibrio calviensis TaxID=91359 RepID=UPI00138E2495|nr:replication/maintenance protein RepL [Enterovibrio calviensis]